MAVPEALAMKIAKKAEDVLAPLRIEMTMNRWKPEFRRIMWEAVAATAMAEAGKTEEAK